MRCETITIALRVRRGGDSPDRLIDAGSSACATVPVQFRWGNGERVVAADSLTISSC
jgi:hypothetical protein